MSLHAEVAVPARDRRRLEWLCRYVARPRSPASDSRSARMGGSRCASRHAGATEPPTS
jgi:hypothetical protein